jgi:synaptobrevin family protein YKT6
MTAPSGSPSPAGSPLPAAYQLYSIIIFKVRDGEEKPVVLSANYDMSTFGFFQRGKAKEFCTFASRTVAARSTLNVRAKVAQEEHMCYFYRLQNGVTAVVTGNAQYPDRVAFDLVVKAANSYNDRSGATSVAIVSDQFVENSELMSLLAQYQNPTEADKILKLQKDLNEVKTIMYDNIEKLLERGQKIDDLVAQSQDLGMGAKAFYDAGRRMNRRCNCTIM